MTQDNAPIAPKETTPKHSRWGTISSVILNSQYGFASLFMFLLWLIVIYINISAAIISASSGNTSSSLGKYLLIITPVFQIIFTVIGLLADNKKRFAIASLVILGIEIIIILSAFYSFTHGDFNGGFGPM